MNLHDRDLIRRTRKDAIEEGFSQGARNTAIENARNALRLNLSVEQVSAITNLSLDQVKEIAEQIDNS